MRGARGLLATAAVSLASLILSVSDASSQLSRTEFRPGEARANQHQYLASHNSFREPQDVSLAAALDERNVWELELDVRWSLTDLLPIGFWVQHDCGDLAGRGRLIDKLIEIRDTQRLRQGFFFLNIELGSLLCLDPLAQVNLFAFLPQLEALITAVFHDPVSGVPGSIYTYDDDFNGDDNFGAGKGQWPSIQELIRRGKHVAVHVNAGPGLTATTMFFPRVRRGAAPVGTIVLNDDDQNFDGYLLIGDSFLTRYFPPTSLCDIEKLTNATRGAMSRGFTFPSTNCIVDFTTGSDSELYPSFHPPFPTVVVNSHVTNPTTPNDLGTFGKPYGGNLGLVTACSRVNTYNDQFVPWVPPAPAFFFHQTKVDVVVEAGAYNLSGLGPANTFNCPVILRAVGGTVTLN